MDSVLKLRQTRRSLLAAAGGATALALAGMPRISKAAQSSGKITYGYWDSSQTAAVEAQIKAFNEAMPDIEVEPQIVPWADYWTKLQTAVAGGQAFDVFWINSASLPVYASKNALVSIDDIVGASGIDTSVFPAPLVEMYSYNGVQYGLPRDFDTIALYFNKDLFDAAGVDYPTGAWSWEDFRANAEKLTNKDKGIWGAGMQTSWQENYYNFILQNDGHLLNEDRTKCLVDEPAGCEAFEYLTGFFTDDLTPSIAIQQSNAVADTLFPAGQVAMMTGGSFRAGTYGKADAKIDVAPMPKGKKQAGVIHGLANVIWAGSKNPDAAKELVKWMAGKDAAQVLGDSGATIPSMNGMQEAWLAANPNMNLQVFLDAVAYSQQVPDPAVGFEWQIEIQKVVIDGWSGNIPADEICTKAAAAANAVL